MGASHLPKAMREDYRGVTTYFPKSDWNLLPKVSENTGKCKTGIIRGALQEYLARSR